MSLITDLGEVLTKDESASLHNEVVANSSLWTHSSEYWPQDEIKLWPLYFLGSPVYPAKANKPLYESLRPRSNAFLLNTSQFLLDRLLKIFEAKYNRPTEQLAGTSLPGFHIFSRLNEKENFWTISFMHDDRDYLEFVGNSPYTVDAIQSCTVALKLPKRGGGLDYMENGKRQRIEYQEQHAYLWSASVLHRIGTVVLEDEQDIRLSYQLHFIVTPEKLLYYW